MQKKMEQLRELMRKQYCSKIRMVHMHTGNTPAGMRRSVSFQKDLPQVIEVMSLQNVPHRDDAVFIAVNSYWEVCHPQLPELPKGYSWNCDFYTGVPCRKGEDANGLIKYIGDRAELAPRSVAVFSLKTPSA